MPELDSLSSNSSGVISGRDSCHLGNLLEVKLDVIILLCTDFDQGLHRVLSNIVIFALEGLEHLAHDKVSFLRHFEVLRRIGDRVKKGLHGKLAVGCTFGVLLSSYHFDVVGQCKHNLILQRP